MITPTEFPVSFVMARRVVQHRGWTLPQWQLLGIVAGQTVADSNADRVLVHSDDGTEQFMWSGFLLHLYKDSAESYWHNLLAQNPSLFVVCREDEQGEPVPFLVTASQDEAAGHEEADDSVYSAPMPPEIHQWLERYVVENYVPRERGKRKRKNWTEDSVRGRR